MSRLFRPVPLTSLRLTTLANGLWASRTRLVPKPRIGLQSKPTLPITSMPITSMPITFMSITLSGWANRSSSHRMKRWVSRLMPRLARSIVRYPVVVGAGLWLLILRWDWPFAVAIASGLTVAVAVYLYQLRRLHVNWFPAWPSSRQDLWRDRLNQISTQVWLYVKTQVWSRCWQRSNQPLSIALMCGMAIALTVGSVAAIYHQTHSLSLALTIGFQWLALSTMVLTMVSAMGGLTWVQQKQWQESETERSSSERPTPPDRANDSLFEDSLFEETDRIWINLASSDPAIRLIAIYRSVHWAQRSETILPNATLDVAQLTACFRVMLSQESNPTIQQALRDGLMALQAKP